MSYTPTEWQTGDVITAEKLNKAEQGIKDAHNNAADISSEISTEVASWLDEHINVTEGVNIDDTLSVAGSAADAKVTGDELSDLKSAFDSLEGGTTGQVLRKKSGTDFDVEWASVAQPTDEQVDTAVNNWLDDHPEATTTVQDGSITAEKLADWVLPFVFPEQFGAKGDGVTDDAPAIQSAINYCIQTGKTLLFLPKTYGVVPYQTDKSIVIYNSTIYALLVKGSVRINFNGATLQVLENTVAVYDVINIRDCENVWIANGTIRGDRDTYTVGGGGGNTQLLGLYDSKNVRIDNMTLTNSKGDCFGHSGVQINQPNVTRPFEDFYMGNIISNCRMTNAARHGMTFSKGRGVSFVNCFINGIQPGEDQTWDGCAVDMEPYYGYGSVFDVSFIRCTMIGNAKGPYAQDSDSVHFDCCYLQEVSFRAALNCLVSDCIITGVATVNSSGVRFSDTSIGDNLTVTNKVDVFTQHGVKPDVVFDACSMNYISCDTRSNAYKLGKCIIQNCEIRNGTHNNCISIVEKDTTGAFDEIIVKNNVISLIFDSPGSSGYIAYVTMAGRLTFEGNVCEFDAFTVPQAGRFLTFKKAQHLNVMNNIFRVKRDRDGTYVALLEGIIGIGDVETPVLLKGNVVNAENVNLRTGNGQPDSFIRIDSNTTVTNLILLDNYVYNVTNLVYASEYLNVLVNKGNVLNNAVVV